VSTRCVLASIAIFAIALMTFSTQASAHSAVVAQEDACKGLEVVDESESLLCTHGGDPPGAFEVQPGIGSASGGGAAAPAPPAPCPDGGVSGKRVEVLYAVPSDRANNYAASLASVRTAVNDADFFLDETTPTITGQHYRWLCENGSDVTVRDVTLIAVGGDGQFTYGDMVNSLQNQTGLGLGSTNFVSSDRAYLVFVDQISGVYPFGGQGDIFNDDSPSPGTNLHQSGPHYSLVNGFSGFVAEHELGHNIGAVQLSAPHSSGGWHCFEENDAMCYSDGGSYFTGGGAIVFSCPTLPGAQFDCGQDDYYNVQPAVGSYLASHWNVSDSAFLTPAGQGADLSITKADAPDPVALGSNLTYMLTVTNNGPDPSTDSTVTDTVPAGTTLVSATPSQGSCSGIFSVTCSLGALAVGASATIEIVVTVDPAATCPLINPASVSGAETDPKAGNEAATTETACIPPPPECAGEVATIVGTNGDDSLVGTPGRDVIQALDGDDAVLGLGGNDLICGDEGDDELLGGTGRDRLLGDHDDDSLSGGRSRDELDGGNGADELAGGRGDDTLAGGRGQDDLVGGADDDELSGNAGTDDLFGGRGDDLVFGGPGTDDVAGGAGDDELSGENADDDITGGPGDDLILGGPGEDGLFGTSGDDQLLGESGDDELTGATGNDSLDGGADTDDCDGGFGTDTDAGCEVLIGFP
jgi:uncharacterized repeat protein (TIGR01451 family)